MADNFVTIASEYITLDAFLKWAGVVDTGGHAKALVASGQVQVNGEVETRRGRKLRAGDKVAVPGAGRWVVAREEE